MIYPAQTLCINQIEWGTWNKVFSNNSSHIRTLSKIRKIHEKIYVNSRRGKSETPKLCLKIDTKSFDKSIYKSRKKKPTPKHILLVTPELKKKNKKSVVEYKPDLSFPVIKIRKKKNEKSCRESSGFSKILESEDDLFKTMNKSYRAKDSSIVSKSVSNDVKDFRLIGNHTSIYSKIHSNLSFKKSKAELLCPWQDAVEPRRKREVSILSYIPSEYLKTSIAVSTDN